MTNVSKDSFLKRDDPKYVDLLDEDQLVSNQQTKSTTKYIRQYQDEGP